MVHEIPVSQGFGKHPTKPVEKKLTEDEAVKEVWKRTPVESNTVTLQTPAFTPWQWATCVLLIVSLVFMAGYFSKDTFIQDRVESIQRFEHAKKVNDAKISELQGLNKNADAEIARISEELKSRGISYSK